MDKNNEFIPILLALIWITGSLQVQKQPFEMLKQHFKSGKMLHAQFTYRYVDSYTNETVSNNGELWISRKKYKVVSPPQTVLVDGETSKVYDSNRNRLIISKYVPEEDDFAPSRLLNGIDSTYTVVQQKKQGDHYIIKLRSKDPLSLYKKIKITLSRQYVPLEIFAVDRANNLITTTFSGGSFIPNTSSIFSITYPNDAKIIDLRN